jgi:hypothetical protein
MPRTMGINHLLTRAVLPFKGRSVFPVATASLDAARAHLSSILHLVLVCTLLGIVSVPVLSNSSPLSRNEGWPLSRGLEKTEQSEKKESGELELVAGALYIPVDLGLRGDPPQPVRALGTPEMPVKRHALAVHSPQKGASSAPSEFAVFINSKPPQDELFRRERDIGGDTSEQTVSFVGDPRPFWSSDISPPSR